MRHRHRLRRTVAVLGQDQIGLTATLTINGMLIVAAGLLGRWRLSNHPEALRGLMKSLVR